MRDAGLRETHEAELQVGLLVVVSLVALTAGLLWVSQTSLWDRGTPVYAVTTDAGNLSSGDPVVYLGVQVGSVKEVRLVGRQVVVRLRIGGVDSLPADTRAIIRPSGFLGSQLVELLAGDSARPLSPDDSIPATTAPDLQSVATRLGDQTGDVMARARELLSEASVRDVRRSTADLASAMETLNQMVQEQRSTVSALIGNLDRASAQLAAAAEDGEIRRAVANLDSVSHRLRRASTDLESSSSSLSSILDKMDRGEGSLGRLVNDETLYVNATEAVEKLQSASEEIAALSRAIRQDPGKYLNISVF